jgi:cholesterol oxidase
VLLAHGLGVSSRIFSTDLIETNLLEYLTAHQYDVWLLDFRSSIALAASRSQYTADDVVMKDWPAVIANVRAKTGASEIQVVAHCYGALTFSMALLAGLRGVRSAVLSQVSAHLECPMLADIKAGLHTPNLLEKLGVSSLNADAKKSEGFFARLYDKALSLYPIDGDERCSSAVCHRISFMYGLLYEHAQLNRATHESLHELFGEATIGAFEGLAQMIRAGHVLRADGSNAYLPNLRNMSLPLLFLHGSENGCYLPESTEKTFNALVAKNGAQWYSRRVISGYGHIDGIIGKDAVKDVYPLIVEHLNAYNPKP